MKAERKQSQEFNAMRRIKRILNSLTDTEISATVSAALNDPVVFEATIAVRRELARVDDPAELARVRAYVVALTPDARTGVAT